MMVMSGRVRRPCAARSCSRRPSRPGRARSRRSSSRARPGCGRRSAPAGRRAASARPSSSGQVSPHTKACMQPIEVPMTRRRWSTFSPSVTSAVLGLDHVVVVVVREARVQPVARLRRLAVADVVGRMMKYFVASSSWPGPNSSSANCGRISCVPAPPVPCRISTALSTWPAGVALRRRRASCSGCAAPAAFRRSGSGSRGSRSRRLRLGPGGAAAATGLRRRRLEATTSARPARRRRISDTDCEVSQMIAARLFVPSLRRRKPALNIASACGRDSLSPVRADHGR